MSIPITRYVDINSTVGAGVQVSQRLLVGRIFDTNALIPTNSFLSFTTASQVGDYFGLASEEYSRAVFYFSWVSKNRITPDVLQFASYTPNPVPPRVFGAVKAQDPGDYLSITAGSFGITIGAEFFEVSALDLSTAVGLDGVATLITAAINSLSNDTMWAAALVTYDAVEGRFLFFGGEAVDDSEISISVGTSGNVELASLLGWLAVDGAIYSGGSTGQTPVEAVQASANVSDNFGSFLFMQDLTLDEVTNLAIWNNLPENNLKFMYLVAVDDESEATTYAAALAIYGGTGLTLRPIPTEYPEQAPMMILAATNYANVNSAQNYMYQQFPGLTPSVTTESKANVYDGLRVNYYGETQTAGQNLSFYQRGNLQGDPNISPIAMNVYANEIWLKSTMTSTLIELLLTVNRLPANKTGTSRLLSVLQTVIQQALDNGVISVNKQLSDRQIAYITDASDNDENAWYQVQNSGYWVNADVESFEPTPGNVEFKAVYTLIYGKDDVINKIEGEQILI